MWLALQEKRGTVKAKAIKHFRTDGSAQGSYVFSLSTSPQSFGG
jgi:hypothetical protein